jgi:hypothetical protein
MTPLPSSEVKATVTPVARLEKRKKVPQRLKRSEMERKPSRLRRTPLGHASAEQKRKTEAQGCRVSAWTFETGTVHPAHVVDRGIGGCDSELCVIGLRADLHREYDRGELSILEFLTLEEQEHAAGHLGLLGALKRTTGESYVPERLLRVVSDDGEI